MKTMSFGKHKLVRLVNYHVYIITTLTKRNHERNPSCNEEKKKTLKKDEVWSKVYFE